MPTHHESTGRHIYRRSVDPAGNDSLARLARAVAAGATVLEVGTATGYFGRYLSSEKGCVVDGVEGDPGMAAQARPHYRKLLVANLEQSDIGPHFLPGSYDFVVCADILEHLREPDALLRQLQPLLKPDGQLLVSIPNVAYAGILIALQHGDFPYRFEGLLDETHIRFFTRSTAKRLLETASFVVCDIECVSMALEDSEFRDFVATAEREEVARLRALPDALTYQFIIRAKSAAEPAFPRETAPVDVIVPVYRGFEETQRCIEAVLGAPTLTPYELIVIDDASPESAIVEYLDDLAVAGRITLIRHAENQGFVRSANEGMLRHSGRDVVLLNSDTEVNGDWLDRLRRCALTGEDVATVTPFTNNGTICSYPTEGGQGLPAETTAAQLDALFGAVNAGQWAEIPTGVGFCLYIRRHCLDNIGLFDAQSFGRGYGEEVDFSMRAAAGGYRHLLAADVFVYHAGECSFGADADGDRTRNQAVINSRYPHYGAQVEAFRERDPARAWRRRVDAHRIRGSRRPVLLFVAHTGGGGTDRHIDDLTTLLRDKAEVLCLRPVGRGRVKLAWHQPGEAFAAFFEVPEEHTALVELLQWLGVARIHYHHLLGHAIDALALARDLGIPYDFTAHDFFPICPQYQLTGPDGAYCGEPDEAACNQCIQERPAQWGLDIGAWRTRFGGFLEKAERVIAPSEDTASRLRRHFPEARIEVWPHPESPTARTRPRVPQPDTWKVLVIGRLTPEKGLHLLQACAIDAAVRGLPLTFILLGYATEPVRQWPEIPLRITGEYRDPELEGLITLERPDCIYFPARWPETWSYTLSAAMATGYPIVAPRIGAFPERLAGYPPTLLAEWDTPAPEWNELILGFLRGTSADQPSGTHTHEAV